MSAIIDPTKPQPSPAERLALVEQHILMLANTLSARMEELENGILNLSQALAEKEHGKELVSRALAAAKDEDGRIVACLNTGHPYGELVDWYLGTQTN